MTKSSIIAIGHGVQVEIHPDGNVTVYTDGTVRTIPANPLVKNMAPVLDWPDNPLGAQIDKILNQKNIMPGNLFTRVHPIWENGIFVGVWEPQDHLGSLGKTFSIYAAPEDLTNIAGKKAILTYPEVLERTASLRNWHGRDGAPYKNDKEFLAALRTGAYKGEWFVPTTEILAKKVWPHRESGGLKETFGCSILDGCGRWYWTCTEYDENAVSDVDFTDGSAHRCVKTEYQQATRLVRAEPAPSLPARG